MPLVHCPSSFTIKCFYLLLAIVQPSPITCFYFILFILALQIPYLSLSFFLSFFFFKFSIGKSSELRSTAGVGASFKVQNLVSPASIQCETSVVVGPWSFQVRSGCNFNSTTPWLSPLWCRWCHLPAKYPPNKNSCTGITVKYYHTTVHKIK